MSVAEKLFALGRAYLRREAPYLAHTLYGLVPMPVPGCGTMAVTEGMVMYYDPVWIESEPAFQTRGNDGKFNGHECIAACIHHECQHIIRGMDRLAALPDPELANIAADIAINYDLRNAGWRLPPWVVYPETYGFKGGLALEAYYKLLAKNKQAALSKLQQMLKEAGFNPGQGKQQQGQGQPKKGDPKDEEGEGGSGGSKPKMAPMAGQCGGAAGNPVDKDLEKKLDEEVGRPKSDVERIKKVTVHEIKEHIAQHGRGSAPGFSVEELPRFTKKRSLVDWKSKLSRVIRRSVGAAVSGADDYSLRHPSKRSLVVGVIRPGLIDQLCEVALVLDTSASMGTRQLQAAKNEAIAIMTHLGIDEAWFINADTEVHTCNRMRLKDIPNAKPVGRGGTDFRKSFDKIKSLRPKPDVVVYLTDGDGTAPKVKPAGYEVVWCIVPTPYGAKPAEWGTMVLCDNNQTLYHRYGY